MEFYAYCDYTGSSRERQIRLYDDCSKCVCDVTQAPFCDLGYPRERRKTPEGRWLNAPLQACPKPVTHDQFRYAPSCPYEIRKPIEENDDD